MTAFSPNPATRSPHARRTGYLVVDRQGRTLGRLDGIVYGGSPEAGDALSLRFGLRRRRSFAPTEAIELVDDRTRIIGLRLTRDELWSAPDSLVTA